MGKTIVIANQKGGVGKTTTAINMAGGIAEKMHSVLLVDVDPQSNATSGIGLGKENSGKSVYECLIGEKQAKDSITVSSTEWLDVLPSDINLIGAEIELVSMFSRETKLRDVLTPVKDSYDYILIDCPPSLGLLTVNALVASDAILIPMQCEYYAMEGLTQLLKTIHLVRQALNPGLELEGVVLTMYDSRLRLDEQVIKEIRKCFGDKVYKTVIPRNVRLAEAPSYGKTIFQYDRSSKGAESYGKLVEEFCQRNGYK
ncbi:MAG: AAA family ATPase [Elusimicrobiota bacterium]